MWSTVQQPPFLFFSFLSFIHHQNVAAKQDEQANSIKLRVRPRSPKHRRLFTYRFHSTTSYQTPFVILQSFIYLLQSIHLLWDSSILSIFLCRRDLLDISPTLTEAAGAIVDVILLLTSRFCCGFYWLISNRLILFC